MTGDALSTAKFVAYKCGILHAARHKDGYDDDAGGGGELALEGQQFNKMIRPQPGQPVSQRFEGPHYMHCMQRAKLKGLITRLHQIHVARIQVVSTCMIFVSTCIHFYPLFPSTCILYRRQNCR